MITSIAFIALIIWNAQVDNPIAPVLMGMLFGVSLSFEIFWLAVVNNVRNKKD